MPIEHFLCDKTKLAVDYNSCINCATSGRAKAFSCGHSPDVLRGIKKNIKQPTKEFTVTELLDCKRAIWLKRKHGYGVFPSKMFWAFRGQIFHKLLADSAQTSDIVEKRFTAKIGNVLISGQPDLIRGPELYDFKTVSNIPTNPPEHHLAQLSLYAHILEKQDSPIKIRKAFLVYLSFHSHKMLEVALWDESQVRRFFDSSIFPITIMLEKKEAPLFGDYWQKSFRCGENENLSYCDVRELCLKDKPDEVMQEETPKRRVKQKSQAPNN